MKVRLERFKHQDKQTLGMYYLQSGKKLCALELAWKDNKRKISCIPTGIYQVVVRESPKYGKHFHIKDVPNRDMILIHGGNFHTQILGCQLPGLKHSDANKDGYLDVVQSKDALKIMLSEYPEGFELEIVNC